MSSGLMPPQDGSLMPRPSGVSDDHIIEVMADAWERDVFAATAGQTVFTLSKTPEGADPEHFFLFINGVKMTFTTEYTVSGTTLTWLDVPFVLSVGDTVMAKYIAK